MSAFLQVLKIIGYILLGFTVYQVLLRLIRRNWHFPAPALLAVVLNSCWRAFLQDPRCVIERSGIKNGDQVLEIGCGGGFFLPYAAETVQTSGQIFGLDISPEMLDHCRRYLQKFPPELRNRIKLFNKNAYELPFADSSLDVVYLVAALMEIPNPQLCLEEVQRVLKSDGILAVTEFLPDPDYPGRRVTIRTAAQAGFHVEAREGNLWTYTVRFRKSELRFTR